MSQCRFLPEGEQDTGPPSQYSEPRKDGKKDESKEMPKDEKSKDYPPKTSPAPKSEPKIKATFNIGLMTRCAKKDKDCTTLWSVFASPSDHPYDPCKDRPASEAPETDKVDPDHFKWPVHYGPFDVKLGGPPSHPPRGGIKRLYL